MKYLIITIFIILTSCGKPTSKQGSADSILLINEKLNASEIKLVDKNEKFLWREEMYDSLLKDTINHIILNEGICKNLSEPERAALGFVSTFIGSECNWDGEANDNMSNLKCKTLTALDLGYQCSEKHLGFLQKWFKNDINSLNALKECPTIPYTATSQNTFDYMNLVVVGNKISVNYGAYGINFRIGDSWSYTETDVFLYENDNIKLIKKNKSKVYKEHLESVE